MVVVLLILVMIAGASNAVNLTDGLDGLATGASTMVFGAYTLVNIWQNNQWCALDASGNKCYEVRDPLDLAVVAAALTGACFGFLWWNASPAKIFMGDTGSLALGGALAGFAILTRTEFLLAILGGLFVIITMSVILQVGYFKVSGGKRIFRMAPLQHHFELKGWAEITIVIRFWIITGICVAAGPGHLLRRVGRRRMTPGSQPAVGTTSLGRRPGGRDRHRRVRVRRRRQPHPPRRAGHRARRVEPATRSARRPTCSGCSAPPSGSAPGSTAALPEDVDLVVTSPGWPPDRAAARAQAGRRGVPVWGEVELAWRLRDPEHPGTWLCVTGTNGKTTTVQMLDAILRPPGCARSACGNVGLPIVEAVMDPEPYAVSPSSSPASSCTTPRACPRTRPPCSTSPRTTSTGTSAPTRWPTTPRTRAGSTTRSSRPASTTWTTPSPSGWSATPTSSRAPGPIGFTLGTPAVGMVGLVEDVLADRAFVEQRDSSAAELCTLGDLASPAPHFVANALAAAALARSVGVPGGRRPRGAPLLRPDGHRIAEVAEVAGVRYVDDSKATNPHAARSSLQAYDPVVWVAGGLAKGATFDDLVTRVGERLRGVVLLGRDRAVIAEALARHAPDVPVIEVGDGDTSVMDRVVEAASGLAQPGDTVLLAPGCASMDMFANYGARGDAFAESVRRLSGR